MLKAWSITTTVRNPERLRDFLIALQPLEGKLWNKSSQEEYQKILIQSRLYGYGSAQFYNGLDRDIVNTVNNIDIKIENDTLTRILKQKNYREFSMRGRQSLNPLTKFGFVYIDNKRLKITKLGNRLISAEKDYGNIFLNSFIKWQIPNPASDDFSNNGDYGTVPFVATLKLISEVNNLERLRGGKAVGLQKREFALFVPTLVKHDDISKYANKIIKLRDSQIGKTKDERKEIRESYRSEFISTFLGTDDKHKIKKFTTNLQDYGDNAIRYFRLTKFIRIRGNGYYVDLEPSRYTEIESIFASELYKPKTFSDKNSYLEYMSNDRLPILPWETREKLLEIANRTNSELSQLHNELGSIMPTHKDVSSFTIDELKSTIEELRLEKKRLQEHLNHLISHPVESITKYISQLNSIYTADNRPLLLEYITTLGLHSLNDAKAVKPNYPVGDDNEPTSTAPSGMADIECYYKSFNMICEVTMLKGRDQWFNEGQPVMRHLRDFENQNENAYCIFIAPTIHEDTAETFWIANTVGYKGSKQNISPITIKQFILILTVLKQLREDSRIFTHDKLLILIQRISSSAIAFSNSDEWVANTSKILSEWSASLLNTNI